jgi:two-component system, NtrC family, response regulator HydG
LAKENRGHVLVVDDDAEIVSILTVVFQSEGYTVSSFSSAEDALIALGNPVEDTLPVDVILSDLQMARMSGMRFLKTIRKERPDLPVIIITASASVSSAVEAMHAGAYHYVTKPFNMDELLIHVERAQQQRRLLSENEALRREVDRSWGLGDLLGKSAPMKAVFDLVARVAPSQSNVLITGESGTGKEMVAQAIHQQGTRTSGPFVSINCAAIPEALLESELFGHAKGAFTGAMFRKAGLLVEANGGTLFLDEIGDMTPALQAKLLRVIQERKVRPVGENQSVPIDVRFVAATHRDLKAEIAAGRFREDLFYRLSVIPISLPPLRDRPQDIPLLVRHFLRKFTAAAGPLSTVRSFSAEALSKLATLRWQGNVRELENLVERIVVLCPNAEVRPQDIPDPDTMEPEGATRAAFEGFPTLAQVEERYTRLVLERLGGRKDQAALLLGINRRTLYRKEREYGWVTDAPNASEKKPKKPFALKNKRDALAETLRCSQ